MCEKYERRCLHSVMFRPAKSNSGKQTNNQQPTQHRNTRDRDDENERSMLETHHPERPSSSFEGSFQLYIQLSEHISVLIYRINTKTAPRHPNLSYKKVKGREPFRSAAKSLASSCLSDSSGYDPKAVPEFEPDRGNSLCPQCSYPGVFSPRNPNPLRKLRHRSTTSLRMQSVRADFFSHFQKSGDERKPQGEPPSCVIWRNPCQEARYFHPLDADHVCIDRVGWVGWIGSGRY